MSDDFPLVGWREWLNLPDLGIFALKAKIDTGARSSALHAFNLEVFQRDELPMISFSVHPIQHNTRYILQAEAPLLGWRTVRNSGGYLQSRPIISTSVCLSEYQWLIELTLTNRDLMGFRMLLGRKALEKRFLVNPGGSFLLSCVSSTCITHPSSNTIDG